MPQDIYVFWDNSNVFIPAQDVASAREPGFSFDRRALQIHFENLMTLVRCGRRLAYGIAVGSLPGDMRSVWEKLKEAGLAVELFERGSASNTEQGCDQCLQVHMLRTLCDHAPAVAVLLTGDGKGFEDGVGFHADLDRMYRRGWGIEVVAWDIACSKRLKEWAQRVGVYIPLEDYYEHVTFVEQGRKAKDVSKRLHPISKPHAIRGR